LLPVRLCLENVFGSTSIEEAQLLISKEFVLEEEPVELPHEQNLLSFK